jgi:hypothetical protein
MKGPFFAIMILGLGIGALIAIALDALGWVP